MTGDSAVVRVDHAAAMADAKAALSNNGGCGCRNCNVCRAYLELANFSEGLECNVDALIQRCQEADATIRQQARERDKFAFDRQQLWAALKASEASTAELLKALDGLLSPDKMSVYGTMDKIAAAWAAIAAAKGGASWVQIHDRF